MADLNLLLLFPPPICMHDSIATINRYYNRPEVQGERVSIGKRSVSFVQANAREHRIYTYTQDDSKRPDVLEISYS